MTSANKDEFPYELFPWKLIYKDGKEVRKCYFEREEHRKRHIDRYKLKKKDIKLSHKYEDTK